MRGRPPAAFAGVALVLGVCVLAVAWPRFVADRGRAIEAARAMAGVAVPAEALGRARVTLTPGTAGWSVVFRGADLPCAETDLCRRAAAAPEGETVRDILVCVEYGTGRAYAIAAMVAAVGPLGGDCAGLRRLGRPAGAASRGG